GDVGEDFCHPVGLEIEQPAAVGNDGELKLVRAHRNAIERLVEQVDARRGVERKELLAHRRGELRFHLVEGEDDVDGLGLETARDLSESVQVETEKTAGKGEIVAQEVKAAE